MTPATTVEPLLTTVAAKGASEVHFLLAEKILERMTVGKSASHIEKEEKKVLFSMLGKLHLPAGGCDGELLKSILTLLEEASETKVAPDATSKNTLTKLQGLLVNQIRDLMTAERGGGGEEDTVLDLTVVAPGAEQTEVNLADGSDGDVAAEDGFVLSK